MPRICTICVHPQHQAIDLALAGGATMRELAALYRVSPDAIERHNAAHLPARLVKAREAEEVAQADDLLSQVRNLQGAALRILGVAEQTGDLRVALGAIREARGNLELLAKLLGELQQEGTVNVLVAPEWLAIRTGLFTALTPYPEAKLAVAANIAALEVGRG